MGASGERGGSGSGGGGSGSSGASGTNRGSGQKPTFREKVLEALRQELGEPGTVNLDTGTVYRWKVRCPGDEGTAVAIYITLDSPELPDYAHLFISDPTRRGGGEPIIDFISRTDEEIPHMLRTIREKIAGCEGQQKKS